MRSIVALCVALIVEGPVATASEPCPVEMLSSLASAQIAVIVAAREHFVTASKPPSGKLDPNAEDELVWAYYDLIEDKSAVADEALAALVGYYNGESSELECEVLQRGARMLPYLERFDRCPPNIELPASTVFSRAELYSDISQGTFCER